MFKNVTLGIAAAVFLAGCSGGDGVSEYDSLAKDLSDDLTRVQFEDCAHILSVANKVGRDEGGDVVALKAAQTVLNEVFSVAYRYETGETLMIEKIAERSPLYGSYTAEMMVTGKGQPDDFMPKLLECSDVSNRIGTSDELAGL